MVQSAAIAADSTPLSAFFQGRFNSNLFYAIHHFFLVCHLASHLDPFHLACRTSDQQAFYTSYASPIGNYRQLNAAAKKNIEICRPDEKGKRNAFTPTIPPTTLYNNDTSWGAKFFITNWQKAWIVLFHFYSILLSSKQFWFVNCQNMEKEKLRKNSHVCKYGKMNKWYTRQEVRCLYMKWRKKKTCKSIFVALNLILVVLSCDHTTRAIMSPINDLVTGSDCHFFPFVTHSYLMRFLKTKQKPKPLF